MNKNIIKLSNAIKIKRPVLAEVLNTYSHLTISEYASLFKKSSTLMTAETVQNSSDFIEICSIYTEKYLGKSKAVKIKQRLEKYNDILTSNHHGPTFCNIQIQGEIVYALSENKGDIMPVFAFGDIPLNNSTYPRGIKLSTNEKLSLFPDSKKNSLVSFVEAFSEESVNKALVKCNKLHISEKISDKHHRKICDILNNIYLDKHILNYDTYSEQSVVINSKLWEKLFDHSVKEFLPEKACFEIEKIVSELLFFDLVNNNSLIFNLFYNHNLKESILKELDRQFGCWDNKKLTQLPNIDINDHEYPHKRNRLLAGSGTHFFWGIDAKKRRIALRLTSINGIEYLTGIDDSKNEFKIEFNQNSLCQAIKNNTLLPSLFTCFTTISFARGFQCYGGFMQTDYLSNMRDGLVKALRQCNKHNWAEIISKIKTNNYCTGLQFILSRISSNTVFPSGTVEIISNGGLSHNDIQFIKNISLDQANLLGMPVKYPAVYRRDERDDILENISIDNIINELGKDKFIVLE